MSSYLYLLEDAHAVDMDAEAADLEQSIQRPLRSGNNTHKAFRLSDAKFIKTYRLPKPLVLGLIEELAPHLQPKGNHANAVVKVLVALAFYAVGSYQTLVGQCQYHCVSQSSVSRAIKQVTAALNKPEVFGKYVSMPATRDARENIKRGFFNKFSIPGVLGCIDGTQVAIVTPLQNEERYFNRKGYHSLNVMIVCDSNMNILHVDATHPGSTHDSKVWNNSDLKDYMSDLCQIGENVFLLGDSGYPLRKTLLTPILNAAPSTPEAYYYELHVTARNVVERCIGVLKARFRCLLSARVLHYDPVSAAHIANACCILHNIARAASVEVPELLPSERLQIQADLLPSFEAEGSLRTGSNISLAQGRERQRNLVDLLWRQRRWIILFDDMMYRQDVAIWIFL